MSTNTDSAEASIEFVIRSSPWGCPTTKLLHPPSTVEYTRIASLVFVRTPNCPRTTLVLAVIGAARRVRQAVRAHLPSGEHALILS